jgi:hypothetical protein
MLEISTEMRHQSLSDFPEILYKAIENSKEEDRVEIFDNLNYCQD